MNIDDIDDLVILEQIESLKELRDEHPSLTRSINEDLNVLMSQINCVDIKNYNKVNFLIRNDVENDYVNILFWMSVFEGSGLTNKQKDLLLEIVEGYGYSGKHKDYGFMINKIQRSKERNNKMSNDKKRQFTTEQLRKLFPNYYAKPNERWDEYLNISRKLEIYEQSVEESKIKGDYLRQLSLEANIKPLTLDKE